MIEIGLKMKKMLRDPRARCSVDSTFVKPSPCVNLLIYNASFS